MKHKIIMNTLAAILTLALLVTISYAWWTGSEASSKVEITTANIASEVTLYKGIDENRDGNVELNSENKEIFEKVIKKQNETGKEALNFYLEMLDMSPKEIFTWKVVIENKGDVDGYVAATLSTLFNNQNKEYQSYEKYIKFLTISIKGESKAYFANALYSNKNGNIGLLFGGRRDDLVRINESKEYIFQIELEDFEVLLKNTSNITEADREAYNSLNGIKKPPLYSMIDISLISGIEDKNI